MERLEYEEIQNFKELYDNYLRLNHKVSYLKNSIADIWKEYQQLNNINECDELLNKIESLEKEYKKAEEELNKNRDQENNYMNFLENKYNKEFIVDELKRIFLHNA